MFAELGIKTGTKRIARLAEKMGIRTKLSTNPSMTLGGLKEGVTPLEMAYAYSTIANDGVRMTSSLAPDKFSPIGFSEVKGGRVDKVNEVKPVRVFSKQIGELAKSDAPPGRHERHRQGRPGRRRVHLGQDRHYRELRRRLVRGRQRRADRGGLGGLCGQASSPMETEHAGSPVAGGTFPAEIFHDFMLVLDPDARRAPRRPTRRATTSRRRAPYTTTTPSTEQNAVPDNQQQPTEQAPKNQGQGQGQGDQPATPPPDNQPQNPAPEPQTPAEPNPTPTPPTGGGTGGGASPG